MVKRYGCVDYHEAAAHSRKSKAGWKLDWSTRPGLYKEYRDQPLRTHALARKLDFPDTSLKATVSPDWRPDPQAELDEAGLAAILYLGNGVTAERHIQGEVYHFRSAASAGALYPIEIYVSVPPGVNGVHPGLYHYHPGRHELCLLRHSWHPPDGSMCDDSGQGARKAGGLVFYLTAVFHRSAWKYQDRAYRYVLLDCGHVLENLIQALRAFGLDSETLLDFDDRAVNSHLGLTPEAEGCLAVLTAEPGGQEGGPPADAQGQGTGDGVIIRADGEFVLPDGAMLRAMHEACFVVRKSDPAPLVPAALGLTVERAGGLETWDEPEGLSTSQSITARRSRRNYSGVPLERGDADIVLGRLADMCLEKSSRSLSRTAIWAVLSRSVNGLANGMYVFDPETRELSLSATGDYHGPMASACLEQLWLGRANLLFCFLSDPGLLQKRFGPRGYRYAMIQAGRAGQRIYLTSTSLGLGACGIGAFYDAEAAGLLRMKDSSRLMYLVASGRVKSV